MLAALLALLCVRADAFWIKPGASGTVGSAGYGKWALTGDAGWKKKAGVEPYAWSELGGDNFERWLSLVGGASKDLGPHGLQGRAGAGFTAGRVRDSDGSAASFLLELGLDRDLGPGTLSGDYRLTAGTLASTSYSRGAARGLREADRRAGPPPRGGPPGSATARNASQTQNDLSGSYWLPFDGWSLTLRETLGLSTYATPVYTTSATAKVKVGRERLWSLFSSVAGDAGGASGLYVSAGFSRLFE